MKIYIAARYERKREMWDLRSVLRARGHEVTSTWLDIEDDVQDSTFNAETDLHDINRSDYLVLVTEPGVYSRGGRHVEMGYALAKEKRVCVIGDIENIFQRLAFVERFASISHFLENL